MSRISRCVSTSSCSRRDRRLLFTALDVSDDSTCGPSYAHAAQPSHHASELSDTRSHVCAYGRRGCTAR